MERCITYHLQQQARMQPQRGRCTPEGRPGQRAGLQQEASCALLPAPSSPARCQRRHAVQERFWRIICPVASLVSERHNDQCLMIVDCEGRRVDLGGARARFPLGLSCRTVWRRPSCSSTIGTRLHLDPNLQAWASPR